MSFYTPEDENASVIVETPVSYMRGAQVNDVFWERYNTGGKIAWMVTKEQSNEQLMGWEYFDLSQGAFELPFSLATFPAQEEAYPLHLWAVSDKGVSLFESRTLLRVLPEGDALNLARHDRLTNLVYGHIHAETSDGGGSISTQEPQEQDFASWWRRVFPATIHPTTWDFVHKSLKNGNLTQWIEEVKMTGHNVIHPTNGTGNSEIPFEAELRYNISIAANGQGVHVLYDVDYRSPGNNFNKHYTEEYDPSNGSSISKSLDTHKQLPMPQLVQRSSILESVDQPDWENTGEDWKHMNTNWRRNWIRRFVQSYANEIHLNVDESEWDSAFWTDDHENLERVAQYNIADMSGVVKPSDITDSWTSSSDDEKYFEKSKKAMGRMTANQKKKWLLRLVQFYREELGPDTFYYQTMDGVHLDSMDKNKIVVDNDKLSETLVAPDALQLSLRSSNITPDDCFECTGEDWRRMTQEERRDWIFQLLKQRPGAFDLMTRWDTELFTDESDPEHVQRQLKGVWAHKISHIDSMPEPNLNHRPEYWTSSDDEDFSKRSGDTKQKERIARDAADIVRHILDEYISPRGIHDLSDSVKARIAGEASQTLIHVIDSYLYSRLQAKAPARAHRQDMDDTISDEATNIVEGFKQSVDANATFPPLSSEDRNPRCLVYLGGPNDTEARNCKQALGLSDDEKAQILSKFQRKLQYLMRGPKIPPRDRRCVENTHTRGTQHDQYTSSSESSDWKHDVVDRYHRDILEAFEEKVEDSAHDWFKSPQGGHLGRSSDDPGQKLVAQNHLTNDANVEAPIEGHVPMESKVHRRDVASACSSSQDESASQDDTSDANIPIDKFLEDMKKDVLRAYAKKNEAGRKNQNVPEGLPSATGQGVVPPVMDNSIEDSWNRRNEHRYEPFMIRRSKRATALPPTRSLQDVLQDFDTCVRDDYCDVETADLVTGLNNGLSEAENEMLGALYQCATSDEPEQCKENVHSKVRWYCEELCKVSLGDCKKSGCH